VPVSAGSLIALLLFLYALMLISVHQTSAEKSLEIILLSFMSNFVISTIEYFEILICRYKVTQRQTQPGYGCSFVRMSLCLPILVSFIAFSWAQQKSADSSC